MTTHGPSFIPSFRQAILLGLGLSASALAGASASGCADRGGFALCVDETIDYETCTGFEDDPPFPPEDGAPDIIVREVCFDGTDGCDPCDVDGITGAAIDEVEFACSDVVIESVKLVCGPDPSQSDCCYKVRVEGQFSCAQEGRPLLTSVDATPRVATLRTGEAWRTSVQPELDVHRPADPAVRASLRRRWLAAARYEHASVAAFARVSAQLLAQGAPAALVRAAHRAAADEVRHAQVCFELAAHYGAAQESPLEAGALDTQGSVAAGLDLEATLREAIFEGALGEGAAALAALEGARGCADPLVSELLATIAEDEQRHALLAYQTVAWALSAESTREQAAAIIRTCLHEGHELALADPSANQPSSSGEDLRRHGLVSPERRRALHHESWTRLVAPILETLIARA